MEEAKEAEEAKPPYKPTRKERRFMEAMKRRKVLNSCQVASLERLEKLGVKL